MVTIEDKIKTRLGKKIIDWYQRSERRIYLSIKPENIREAAQILFR